ncbi:hypothetical protein ACF05L_34875 [Streptomyces bobili]|uniref:hypothetical protein n=1 Tax=Streptomyces bobili TaxID=67280 RepID=UPI0037009567
MESANTGLVFVTGDPTIDWAVMLPDHRCPTMEERLNSAATTHWHWGGSLGLHELVRLATPDGITVRGQEIPKDFFTDPSSYDDRFHHSFNIIQFLPLPENENSSKIDRRVRVREFLGFHSQGENLKSLTQPAIEDGEDLSLLIIDDAGLGFGNSNACQHTFEMAESNDVVIKLGTRALKGESILWQKLSSAPRREKQIIPVVTAASLREIGASISRGLSWERSAQDVLSELKRAERSPNSALSGLANKKLMVVSFGLSGALIIDRTKNPSRNLLYFHREYTEGTWEKSDTGSMFGYTQALTAGIANSLLEQKAQGASEEPRIAIARGVQLGLAAMLAIRDLGFEAEQGFDKPGNKRRPGKMILGNACMTEDADRKNQFKSTQVPEPKLGAELPTWSILSRFAPPDSLESEAVSVALQGSDRLEGVPVARFNKLITADWHEIEGLRIVQNLISEYISDRTKAKPRSIAVFGRPGDGKSFAVREVVKSLYPDRGNGLTFNLSQFESVANLVDALHQVRDRALEGEAPLVFWDEFDSHFQGTPLGWLPYFLSPMQDGAFQQGEIVHPIGRAIFVFAGGTYHRYTEFVKRAGKSATNSKAPDFASRLQGYLDVVGPNSGPGQHEEEAGWMFHRALLLNHFLNDAGIGKKVVENHKEELDVDEGVVRAFLGVKKYNHGARSMHTIVDISRLHRGGRFGRANLPHKTLLNLHVNADRFLEIVREVPPSI